MADPGSGGPWESRTLGVAVPGSGGPWEWRPVGVVDRGSGGPWDWRTLGLADPNPLLVFSSEALCIRMMMMTTTMSMMTIIISLLVFVCNKNAVDNYNRPIASWLTN